MWVVYLPLSLEYCGVVVRWCARLRAQLSSVAVLVPSVGTFHHNTSLIELYELDYSERPSSATQCHCTRVPVRLTYIQTARWWWCWNELTGKHVDMCKV